MEAIPDSQKGATRGEGRREVGKGGGAAAIDRVTMTDEGIIVEGLRRISGLGNIHQPSSEHPINPI